MLWRKRARFEIDADLDAFAIGHAEIVLNKVGAMDAGHLCEGGLKRQRGAGDEQGRGERVANCHGVGLWLRFQGE